MTVDLFRTLAVTPALALTLAFLREREDCFLDAYPDIGGVWTIGFGTIAYPDGRLVAAGDHCSPADAERWLQGEVAGIQSKLLRLVTVPVTPPQLAALTSFCYNCGVDAFRTSTLRRLINLGEPATSPRITAAFLMWIKYHKDGQLVASKGLTNRRRLESQLYATPSAVEDGSHA